MLIKKTKIEVIQYDIPKIKAGDELLHKRYILIDKSSMQDEFKFRRYFKGMLDKAERRRQGAIVFGCPSFSSMGLSSVAVSKIMAQEVIRHLRDGRSVIKEIIFCLADKDIYKVFKRHIVGYIEHFINNIQAGPFITVDAIIEVSPSYASASNKSGTASKGRPNSVVLIDRKNPPFGWALPGGFVDYGESLEEAVTREAKEETGLKLVNLRQFHTYSKPGRDPRFHTIATVFIAKGIGRPKASDDAKALRVVRLGQIKGLRFAFDHKKILKDYIKAKCSYNDKCQNSKHKINPKLQ